MKPIIFILQDFDEGGVQRVTLKNINQMLKDGREVTLVVLKGSGSLAKFLHEDVKLVLLKKRKVLLSIISLTKLLSTVNKANLVSAIVQVNIVVAIANGLNLFKHNHVITEHTHSSLAKKNAIRANLKLAYSLQRIFYPLASKVYCVSRGIMDDLLIRIPQLSSKTFLVTNPVIDDDFFLRSDHMISPDISSFISGKKVALGVGRLVPMKDFSLLIEAFILARAEVGNLVLLIVGDGPDMDPLKKLAREHNQNNSIKFVGHSDNPLPYFRLADVFVLTSKYEGFGLVLVEALALAKSVVSVDCECGPREILDDVGVLVKGRDPRGISTAIIDSLNETQDVTKMRARASIFKADEVTKLYYQGFV